MKQAAEISLASIQWATGTAVDRESDMRSRLTRFDADDEKEKRLDRHECKACFYLSSPRMAGQCSIKRPCGICGETVRSGNTDCNVICNACSETNRLCAHCGGTIDMRDRRKFTAI